MKFAVRLVLVALAIPAIFLLHLYGVLFVGGLLSNYEQAFEWPILGLALVSFFAITTLVIAAIFRVNAR